MPLMVRTPINIVLNVFSNGDLSLVVVVCISAIQSEPSVLLLFVLFYFVWQEEVNVINGIKSISVTLYKLDIKYVVSQKNKWWNDKNEERKRQTRENGSYTVLTELWCVSCISPCAYYFIFLKKACN